MIIIKDKLFPQWLEQSAAEQFYRFPLEYGHRTLDTNSAFFGRTLYNRATGVALAAPYLVDAVCDWIRFEHAQELGYEFDYIERVVVNAQTPDQWPGRHCDYDHDPNLRTVVYFISGKDGDLMFYSPAETVEFRTNRLVSFPSAREHEAEPPTEGLRLTLGISWRFK